MADDAKPQEPKPNAELVEPRPGELTIVSAREGDIHVISLTGELDLATADELEQELARVEATDVLSIVLDLSGLRFMDSTGVRLILGADARSRANSNRLTLLPGPPAVQRVFELTGVIDLLPFAD
jgi:anti-sigma B factor antagonist